MLAYKHMKFAYQSLEVEEFAHSLTYRHSEIP